MRAASKQSVVAQGDRSPAILEDVGPSNGTHTAGSDDKHSLL